MDSKRVTYTLLSTLAIFGLGTVDNLNLRTEFSSQNLYAADSKIESFDVSVIQDNLFEERLQNLNSDFPLPFNQLVKKSLLAYVNNPSSTEKIISLCNAYSPLFTRILEEEGVPRELANLPIIESKLEVEALSHKGAMGLWQFMAPTASIFGLRIDDEIDERKDPEKATRAAAKYLKQLNDRFDNWLLALAAYNCGPGNVSKAIRRAGGKKDFWEIRKYLPRETRYYVPRFIAATYVANYYPFHNMAPPSTSLDMSFDYVLEVDQDLEINKFSDDLGISPQSLKSLNPALIGDYVPGFKSPVKLKIPYQLYQSAETISSKTDEINTELKLLKLDKMTVRFPLELVSTETEASLKKLN